MTMVSLLVMGLGFGVLLLAEHGHARERHGTDDLKARKSRSPSAGPALRYCAPRVSNEAQHGEAGPQMITHTSGIKAWVRGQ